MAVGAVYTTARACGRCGQGLPTTSAANRRYCRRCAHIRRAVTFLRQAHTELDLGGDHVMEALVAGAIQALEEPSA